MGCVFLVLGQAGRVGELNVVDSSGGDLSLTLLTKAWPTLLLWELAPFITI